MIRGRLRVNFFPEILSEQLARFVRDVPGHGQMRMKDYFLIFFMKVQIGLKKITILPTVKTK